MQNLTLVAYSIPLFICPIVHHGREENCLNESLNPNAELEPGLCRSGCADSLEGHRLKGGENATGKRGHYGSPFCYSVSYSR